MPANQCTLLERIRTATARVVQFELANYKRALTSAGYSETETAEALGVSARTVERDWLRARVWLKRALTGSISADEHTAGKALARAQTTEYGRE